jgi:hypothetical protein
MQLHPTDDPDPAVGYAVQALARCLIGFGYRKDPGDLTRLDLSSPLPAGVTKHDVEFATRMAVGDKVLVLVHQYPFALVTVASEYFYLRPPASAKVGRVVLQELGVWFNHFRGVRDVRYYADWVKDPGKWIKVGRAATIQRLVEPETTSFKLIQSWPETPHAPAVPSA